MPLTRQTSFSAGELSPTLYGRTDLPQYGAGLRTCKNFFISKHGAAISRPGTVHVTETASLVADKNYVTRLIPFVFSNAITYVLEFTGGTTGGTIRFVRDGSVVGAPYEIATPYTQADTLSLRFAQVGNYLTVTHPSHPPYELVRGASDTDWTFTPITFDVPEYGGVTGLIMDTIGTPDAAHPAREWRYLLTARMRRRDGTTYETAPHPITGITDGTTIPATQTGPAPLEFPVYVDMPVVLDFRNPGLRPAEADTLLSTIIYRGRGNVFGWIGETQGGQDDANSSSFTDYGDEPDYTRSPPQGRNPFEVYDGQVTLLRTEDPISVGYFEGRQVFGGTTERPGTLWLSTQNDFLNFDQRVGPFGLATDSIEMTLASRRLERIRSVLGGNQLLVFTDSSVWAVSSGTGGPISPTDFVARVQSEIGASTNPPLQVAGSVLYARTKGTGVQDLLYDDNRRGYAGRDLSFLSQHLFAGHTILDWAYAEDPWGVVWVVRSDGKLLSLTYDSRGWAWALHETDGFVQAVCTVPEGSEDAVYLVVRRVIDGASKFYIERMASRRVDAIEDYVGLDCARIREFTIPRDSFSGMLYLAGKTLTALVDGEVVTGIEIDAAGNVQLPTKASKVIIGLPFEAEIETLDVAGARVDQKIVKRVVWEVEASRGLWTGQGAGLWAGETPEQTTEWRQRIVADDFAEVPLHTGDVDVRVQGRWAKHGRAVLRQVDPLPLTVLGVTREIVVGGS